MSPRHVVAVAFAGAVLVALPAGAANPTVPVLREGKRTASLDADSPCKARARPAGSYLWPVKPFDRQHPVRGNFGDPRIIDFGNVLGGDAPDDGSYQFHNGVDIVAPDGTAVYPVADGVVAKREFNYVVVHSRRGRTFQYWHIVPSVRPGARVVAGRTVLGYVRRGQGHVHLTEIDGFGVVNPLAPGHLFPYRDGLAPEVAGAAFRDAEGPGWVPLGLHGDVEVVAEAFDRSSLPVPGAWHNAVVAPAKLSWSLEGRGGRILLEGVAVNFEHRQPLPRHFWLTYARGTYANWPVVGYRRLLGLPGRYLFRLVRLDTLALPNGRYDLEIVAADVCGNEGTLTLPVRVDN